LLIEQAIFTSAETDRAAGYQLICQSRGLTDGDARELALWGPSHDSLLAGDAAAASTNFFRLASGAYCVSRTTAEGAEYSGRGGQVVYTKFLVVPPPVLGHFANNPFALIRAAAACGVFSTHAKLPTRLEPLRIGGRSPAADLSLLAQLARHPGPAAMGTLVQAALACERLAIASQTPCDKLIAGLFNLLPVECRTEFSFTTGLKMSTSRPVRISALPLDPAAWRGIDRHGFTLLDLDNEEGVSQLAWDGWPGYVAEVLHEGKLSALACELESSRPWLNCANLNSIAGEARAKSRAVPQRVASPAAESLQPPAAEVAAKAGLNPQQRADGAHPRREEMMQAVKHFVPKSTLEDLAATLATQPPEILELLERVDDLVFAAISGDDRALTELEVLWPTVAAELDQVVIEQSREQYLRCALSIWGECVDGNVRKPERAVAAIDVLCILFEE
jgi:hypothetical protein